MRSQQLLEHKTKIGRQPELSGQEEGFEKFASDQIYVFQPRMCVISHICISLIVEEKSIKMFTDYQPSEEIARDCGEMGDGLCQPENTNQPFPAKMQNNQFCRCLCTIKPCEKILPFFF